MHYYKRNLGDYAKKAGRLSMLQHGSYTLLIDACYDREQFPTLEEAIEWTWASTTEEVEAVTFVLRKFFILENGFYVQKRIQEELAEYHSKAETNKRIAIDRETKRKELNTNRAEDDTERTQDENEPPPNHKPLTNNHINTLVSNKVANCPYEQIILNFNTALPMLPSVKQLTDKRKKAILARWKEDSNRQSLEWWANFFVYVSKSDFLTGRSGAWSACCFDWIFKSENFVKIIEGNYENKS